MVSVNSEDVYVSFRDGVSFRNFLIKLVDRGYLSEGESSEILKNSSFDVFNVLGDSQANVFASYDIVELIDSDKNDLDSLVRDVFSFAVSRRTSHVRRRSVIEYRYYE